MSTLFRKMTIRCLLYCFYKGRTSKKYCFEKCNTNDDGVGTYTEISESSSNYVRSLLKKTEAMCNEIENYFYSMPEKIDSLIKNAPVHDLSALLKCWLRELPQPLLTNDLLHIFYQTNVLPSHDQNQAMAILWQLLPDENRDTLRELLNFFRRVVEHHHINKMTQQNVARIIAPSFFPPRFLHPLDKNDIGAQVRMTVQCCHLTNVLLTMADSLWLVPQRLVEQSKTIKKNGQVSSV